MPLHNRSCSSIGEFSLDLPVLNSSYSLIIFSILAKLAKEGIKHGDIELRHFMFKPGRSLVKDQIRLIDFGASSYYSSEEDPHQEINQFGAMIGGWRLFDTPVGYPVSVPMTAIDIVSVS